MFTIIAILIFVSGLYLMLARHMRRERDFLKHAHSVQVKITRKSMPFLKPGHRDIYYELLLPTGTAIEGKWKNITGYPLGPEEVGSYLSALCRYEPFRCEPEEEYKKWFWIWENVLKWLPLLAPLLILYGVLAS